MKLETTEIERAVRLKLLLDAEGHGFECRAIRDVDTLVAALATPEQEWMRRALEAEELSRRYGYEAEQLALAAANTVVPDWVAEFLNRRTAVEAVLRHAARTGRSIPPDEAKELAIRLSVPKGLRGPQQGPHQLDYSGERLPIGETRDPPDGIGDALFLPGCPHCGYRHPPDGMCI